MAGWERVCARRLVDALSARRGAPESWSYGTVVSVGPGGATAAVLLDGDGDAVELPVDSGARGVGAGDRVTVVARGREARVSSYRLEP